VEGVQLIDDGTPLICDACKQAKLMCKPIQKEREALLAGTFGTEVHADLWGPSPVSSLGGRRYNVTFTDNYSHFTCLTLLCTKDETFNAYKAFMAWVETQRSVKIKHLCTNRGGEFLSGDFTAFLREQGTEWRLTMHDTPQHNGVAKTLNCHLFEHVRTLLTQAGLPKTLWGEALHFTVWVKNHMLTRVLGNATTPYEWLTGRKPSIAGIPEWGQCIWVHSDSGSKLDAHATIMQWVGYNEESTHAHRIYWENKAKLSMECNIKFITDTSVSFPLRIPSNTPIPAPHADTPQVKTPQASMPSSTFMAPQLPPATSSGEEEMEDEESDSLSTPPPTGKGKAPAHAPAASKKAMPVSDGMRQSTCACKPSAHLKRLIVGKGSADGTSCSYTGWHPYHISLTKLDTDADTGHAEYAYLAGFDDLIAAAIKEAEGDPKSVKEARSHSDWPHWKEAMDHKIDALEQAGTWTTIPRPTDKNVVRCKWVF
jgi:hypothetical protein